MLPPIIDSCPKPVVQPPIRHLFTYGSLMCEDIMATVAGGHYHHRPAILTGFRRFLVRDEHYPGVVSDPAGKVHGIVYHHIPPEGWLRLDLFEGEMYARSPVTVHFNDRTEAQVYCYVFRPEFLHRLTTTDWDFATFLRDGKQVFQSQYCGFAMID